MPDIELLLRRLEEMLFDSGYLSFLNKRFDINTNMEQALLRLPQNDWKSKADWDWQVFKQ